MKTRISLFLVSLLAIAAIASATDLTGNQKRHVVNALPDNTLAEEVSDRLDGVDSIGETATVTVGAEASNAIDVTFQFLDEAGANLAIPIKVTCWQSELTTGLGLVTTAGTSAFTTQTYGTLLKSVTTGVLGDFVTDAAGKLTIRVTQTSATAPNEYTTCTTSLNKIVVSGVLNWS